VPDSRPRGLTGSTRALFRGAVVALSLLLPGTGSADVIHFTSGRQKIGIVLGETDTMIRLQTQAGTIGVPKSTVERIEYASEDENRDLRQQWYVEQRREEREREQRRAEREAEEEARAVAQRGMVEVDGQLMTQAEADRRAQAAANQQEAKRQRVEKYRREQQTLPEAERNTAPLVFQQAHAQSAPGGTAVTAALLNVSRQTYRNIMIEVALVQSPRTDEALVLSQQVITVPVLEPDDIEQLNVLFNRALDTESVIEPRLTITSSTPPL